MNPIKLSRLLATLATTALALCGIAGNAEAQFEITAGTGNTAQNFDLLSISGTNNAWVNDTTPTAGDTISTLDGWSLFNSTGASISTYDAGTGSSTTGNSTASAHLARQNALSAASVAAEPTSVVRPAELWRVTSRSPQRTTLRQR